MSDKSLGGSKWTPLLFLGEFGVFKIDFKSGMLAGVDVLPPKFRFVGGTGEVFDNIIMFLCLLRVI